MGLSATAAVGLAIVLAHVPVSADEPARLSLAFDAAPGCPSRERFEQELAYRTSRLVIDPSRDASSRLDVRITEQRGRYVGKLVLALGGASESRAVTGARCETVVAALSLAAAVLVDPGARTDPLPATLEPAPIEDAGTDADAPEPEPEAAAPPPAPIDAAPIEPPPPPPPPPEGPRFVPSVEIGAGATTAIDGVDPLALLGFGVRRRGTGALRLVGAIATPAEASAAPGTIAYQLQGGRLDVCPLALGDALRLDACAFGAVWAVAVRAPSAAVDLPQIRWLVTPGAIARAGVVTGRVTLSVDVGAGVHVAQERFRIDPAGEVLRVPLVYGLGGVGAALAIP